MYTRLQLDDPVVLCPYDKRHVIAKSQLQRHIVKCEKKYPENYKVMCPYSATHRLFKHDLEEHIITCPMRIVLQTKMYSEPRKHGATNFPLPSKISTMIDCEENWDMEIDDNCTVMTKEDNSSARTSKITDETIFQSNILESDKLRPPLGYSEAMLREINEDICIEDAESVTSSMGIGRGKIIWESTKLKLCKFRRGKQLNNDL